MDDVYCATFSAAIVETLERFPDREAFVHGDRRITFAEAAGQISQIQQMLVDMGVKHGGQVSVLAKNTPEIWLIQAAAYLLGARYSGLHPLGSVDDWSWVCADAEVEVLVVGLFYADVGRQVKELTPGIRHFLVIGESDVGDNLHVVMDRYEPKPLEAGPAEAEDTAWLQYTGGTTGRPKGVEVSHRAMVDIAKVSLAYWQYPATPRYLAVGPITHAGLVPRSSRPCRGAARSCSWRSSTRTQCSVRSRKSGSHLRCWYPP
jgi:fatty-acyl-CoA synthase